MKIFKIKLFNLIERLIFLTKFIWNIQKLKQCKKATFKRKIKFNLALDDLVIFLQKISTLGRQTYNIIRDFC